MKVVVDNFLKPGLLGDATKLKPAIATIKKVELIAAADLQFESKADKYELTLDFSGDIKTWLPNKTSLRAIIEVLGDDSDKWVGRSVRLWTLSQNVKGKLTQVIYGDAAIIGG